MDLTIEFDIVILMSWFPTPLIQNNSIILCLVFIAFGYRPRQLTTIEIKTLFYHPTCQISLTQCALQA